MNKNVIFGAIGVAMAGMLTATHKQIMRKLEKRGNLFKGNKKIELPEGIYSFSIKRFNNGEILDIFEDGKAFLDDRNRIVGFEKYAKYLTNRIYPNLTCPSRIYFEGDSRLRARYEINRVKIEKGKTYKLNLISYYNNKGRELISKSFFNIGYTGYFIIKGV